MAGVTIRVRSDTSQARRELQRLEQSVQNISRRADQVSKSIAAIGAAITVAFGGDALTKASDAFVNMENKVALVVGRTRELDRTLNGLYDVATNTRTTINATTETFNRFGKALGDAASADQLLKVTNTVQQALTISGGSAQAAEAAIFQLGQGLASGTLRGQELNSVLEQAPRIAKAIADSLGVQMGDLRGLAEQGKLTTEVVFGALQGQADAVAAEFALVNGTVGQSITSVGQQITRIIGQFDRSTLAVGSLGLMLNSVAQYFNENATTISLRAALIYNNISNAFRGIYEIGRGVVSVVGALLGRLADAAPAIIVPMLVLNDYIFLGLVAGVSKLTTGFLNLVGAADAFVEGFLGIGFEGTIYRLFNASSLVEFGVALQDLGDSIDTLGRRWYNVFNIGEQFIRSTNVELLRMGIFLGVVDQKILAFRYTSFERLYKILDPIKALLGDIVLAFFGLDIVSTIFIGITAVLQGFFVTVDAVLSVFGVSIRQFLGALGRLDKAIEDINPFNLEQTGDFFEKYVKVQRDSIDEFVKGVKAGQKAWFSLMDGLNSVTMFDTVIDRILKFAKTVERTFFWLYDEIIANSWWTDTMVGVYEKAEEFLGKTLKTIATFTRKVINFFKFENLKGLYFDIKFDFSARDIAAEVSRILDNAARVFRGLIKTANNAIADVYSSLANAVPRLAEILSVGIATAFLAVAAPAFMVKFISVFAAGFAANFTGVITDLLGSAIIRSGFFSDLGAAFGRAVGDIINFIIQNIPLILEGLLQFAGAFGDAFIDQLTGGFALIPQALSGLFGGLFDTLIGVALSSGLFSVLVFGFKDTFEKVKKLGGKEGLLTQVFLGKGRKIAAILGAITLINSALGAFTEGGGFAEILISGGFLAYAFLGKEGLKGLLNRVMTGVGQVFGEVNKVVKTQAQQSNLSSILNIDDFKKQAQSGKFKDALNSLSAGMHNLRRDIDSGKFGYSFSSAWSRGLNEAKKNTDQVFQNVTASMDGYGRRSGKQYSKGFNKAAQIGIGLAIGTLFAGMANSAEAATVSTEAKVNNMLEALQNNFYEIANVGLFLLAIFGPGKITGFFKILGGAVKNILGSVDLLRVAALGKGIASGKNVGLIAQVLFGAAGRLNKFAVTRQVLGFATSIIGPLIRTLGSVALRIAPMLLNPAMWIVGGISILGLILFGEGNTLFEKIDNFFSKIRSNLTGTTKEARKLGRELKKVMPDETVGDQDFSKLISQIGTVDLNRVDEKAFRDLKTSLKSLQKVQERANATFEDTGENTVLELQQLKRATRDVENAIIRTRSQQDLSPVTGALKDVINVRTLLSSERGFFSGLFNNDRLINSTQTPELKKLSDKIDRDEATNAETAQFLSKLLDFLNSAGLQPGGLDERQTLQRDLLRAIIPVIGPEGRGSLLQAPEELQTALANSIAEFPKVIEEVERLRSQEAGGSLEEIRKLSNSILNTFGVQLDSLSDASILSEQFAQSLISSIASQAAAISAINSITQSRADSEKEFKDLSQALNLGQAGFAGTIFEVPDLTFEKFSLLPEEVRKGLSETAGLINYELNEAAKQALKDAINEDPGARVLANRLADALEQISLSEILEAPDLSEVENTITSLRDTTIVSDRDIQNVFKYLTEAGISAETIPGLYDILAGENGKNVPKIAGLFKKIERQLEVFEQKQEQAATGTLERIPNAVKGIFDLVDLDSDLLGTIDFTLISDDQLVRLEDQARKIEDFLSSTSLSVSSFSQLMEIEGKRFNEELQSIFGNIGLYEQALASVDDPINLTDVLKFDRAKQKEIEGLTSELIRLQIAIAFLRKGGVDVLEAISLETLLAELDEVDSRLSKLLSKPDTSTKDTKTAFEKFVENLNSAGFGYSVGEAAKFSKAAISGLKAPLAQVEKLQKSIVKLGVDEVSQRNKAVAELEKQKRVIFDILSEGSLSQARQAFEGLGVGIDFDIATKNNKTLAISEEIFDLQTRLNNANVKDYDTRKQITNELEYQKQILDEMTVKAEEASDRMRSAISDGFKTMLKEGGNMKDFFSNLLDTLSEQIIDTVVDSFVTAFFKASGLETMFDSLFAGLGVFGAQSGDVIGDSIKEGVDAGTKDLQGGGNFWTMLKSGFGSIFGDLKGGFSKVFEGISGFFGGGGLGNIFSSVLGFFGLHAGGIVQNLATGGMVNPLAGQAGKDSVPVMLTPGEYVLPSQRAAEIFKQHGGSSGGTQQFNINVQGDVSRQTRKEIVQMIPQITAGVNATNKENNFKRR